MIPDSGATNPGEGISELRKSRVWGLGSSGSSGTVGALGAPGPLVGYGLEFLGFGVV